VSQINVNPPTERVVETVDTSGDRTAAAGINLVTVLVVLAVLAVIAWFLFTGPLRSMGSTGGQTNINVNPPSQPSTINVNPPSQNPPAAPGGSNSGGSSGSGESNPAPGR
jgi:hypothetical protein